MEKAIAYAEKYGIIEFHVKGTQMSYYTSWPMSRITYKGVINLKNGKHTRTPMKRYYKAYSSRIGGKYQANYMV